MDVVKFVQAVRRHLRVLVVAVLVGAALGVASSFLGRSSAPVTKTRTYYVATHTVGLADPDAELSTPFASLSRIASSATGPEVAALVAGQLSDLGLSASDVQGRLATLEDPNLQTVDIRAVASNEQDAIAIADATATQLVGYIDQAATASVAQRRDELSKRLTTLRNQRTALDGDLSNPAITGTDRDILEAQRDALINEYRIVYDRFTSVADVSTSSIVVSIQPASAEEMSAADYQAFVTAAAAGTNNTQILPPGVAEPGAAPAGSTVGIEGPIPRGLLGAIFGLLVGIGAALALDRFDTRLHTRDDFQRSLESPVLAEIPKLSRKEVDQRRVLVRDAPMSRAAEAYRAVRSSLLFQREDVVPEGRPGYVVMVTSPGPKEGKTTTAANIAVAFAEAGMTVLAVNCDFRRPNLRRMFDQPDDPGKVVATAVPNLWMVTNAVADAGANPAKVVAVQRAAIEQMRDHYDVVVLDTAPLLTTNDPIDVVRVADTVVLVVRADQTRAEALRQAVQTMEHHKVRVAGVILVGVTSVPNAYYYYYSRDTARAAKTAVGDGDHETGALGPDDATDPIPIDEVETNGHQPGGRRSRRERRAERRATAT